MTEFELFKKKINNMTLDELTAFLKTMSECDYCKYSQDYSCEGKNCADGIKQFLEKETK